MNVDSGDASTMIRGALIGVDEGKGSFAINPTGFSAMSDRSLAGLILTGEGAQLSLRGPAGETAHLDAQAGSPGLHLERGAGPGEATLVLWGHGPSLDLIDPADHETRIEAAALNRCPREGQGACR